MTDKDKAVNAILVKIKDNRSKKKFQLEDDIRAVYQQGWVNSNTKGRYKRRR